jgi:uncharacterized protein YhfF
MDGMNRSARDMWMDFLAAIAPPGHQLGQLPETPEAWAFGSGKEMEDELAELVVAGIKRATASSLEGILVEGDPMPRIGGHSVIYDGSQVARCIIRTTVVHVAPLNSVSEAFAWQEGEGDRSVESWLEDHRRFFRAEHEQLEIPFSDSIPVVFEEFVVVWPREIADLR